MAGKGLDSRQERTTNLIQGRYRIGQETREDKESNTRQAKDKDTNDEFPEDLTDTPWSGLRMAASSKHRATFKFK